MCDEESACHSSQCHIPLLSGVAYAESLDEAVKSEGAKQIGHLHASPEDVYETDDAFGLSDDEDYNDDD